ncbi:hypothetical protein PR202_ga26428 [Eleusine coracana subsp. coracana]|uniref:Uncharacterized protein n=1 Tax=Eleusine coracana subsp. coracana TaxID=191504 RepID=A0AAV5DE29_ELECO|nr:hypothetical protein PR202_ga26428 [Eleusine coracana subsp. coracana]
MSTGTRFRRGLGSTPRGPYNRSFPTCQPPYHPQQKSGAWSSAPVLPYAAWPPPMIYSSPSLPLLPSNQPPLLPLPPTATKLATFPCLPAPPPSHAVVTGGALLSPTTVPAAAAPRQSRDRRRRPARPPPSTEPTNKAQKKKPLERATPLPPAPVVIAALDDLEQEVARNFVQDLLHALAPPPSSLPLPSFSLVAKASSPAPAAPSCNVEAAAADAIRGLLRL